MVMISNIVFLVGLMIMTGTDLQKTEKESYHPCQVVLTLSAAILTKTMFTLLLCSSWPYKKQYFGNNNAGVLAFSSYRHKTRASIR